MLKYVFSAFERSSKITRKYVIYYLLSKKIIFIIVEEKIIRDISVNERNHFARMYF